MTRVQVKAKQELFVPGQTPPIAPSPHYGIAELPSRMKSSDLPLHHFDRFFRATGALLVLGLLSVRALTALVFPGLYRGSQLLAPGLIYSLQLLLRWGLYYLHLSGGLGL